METQTTQTFTDRLATIAAKRGKLVEEIQAIFDKIKAKDTIKVEDVNEISQIPMPIYGELDAILGRPELIRFFNGQPMAFEIIEQAVERMTNVGGVFYEGELI